MNIQRAKDEIKDAIEAYFLKDEYGEYVIPTIRQRPIFLIGAPGIGKTQIMEQIARECGVGLVSYTITHHTRQSAIGLPFIEHKVYGDREYAVTEYTMSEIIASVYDRIAESGISEGILFLDEINCVSETLAPAMLQFLQAKTFGTHKVPEGWVIVAAGNPPEYNKSVREFDIVTLDRVKKIVVEENYQIWREYALAMQVHPAILSYLEIKPERFYVVRTTIDGKEFVTARGWEDLSRLMWAYEKQGLDVDQEVIGQYLQHPETAKDFSAYLDLYHRYEAEYQVEDILQGNAAPGVYARVQRGGFDERLSVLGLLLDRLGGYFREFYRADRLAVVIHQTLVQVKQQMRDGLSPLDALEKLLTEQTEETARLRRAKLVTRSGVRERRQVEQILRNYVIGLKEQGEGIENDAAFAWLRSQFAALPEQRSGLQDAAAQALEYAFDFMENAFGSGQEMVVFVTELTVRTESLQFIRENGCERYDRYNRQLLGADERGAILEELNKAAKEQ